MKTTYDIPLSTAATWNGEVGYSDIVDKVISFLCDKSNSVNVLVPGCGRGRLICEIIRKLSEGNLPKKSAGCVDCVDTKNEELEIFKRVLLRDGFILQAKAENADCRVLKLKKGQMIVNLWNTSIQSFLSSEAKKGYDLIAPLLFFHYIPDCWTNVLFDLLGVLNENGIFLTDRIVGDGKRSELLMRALDANNAQLAISQDNNRYPFSFFSDSLKPYEDDVKKEYEKEGAKTDDEQERRLKEFGGILRKNQSFFVRKLKERSSFWGSSIKATDNSILCAVVHGLFNDKETLTSLSFKPSFRSRHLSWSWGEVWSDIECPELVDDIIHDRLGFDFKVYFEATLFRGFEKSKIEELRRQAYVLSTEEALRQFASIPCVLTKPTIGDNYSIREAARFAHDVIPQCMIQTLLSCGILDSNSELDNMFLCFNPPNKTVALVQNLVYAVNLDNREDCSAADRFLANAVYHTIYLKRSLSSTLFAAGKCELIYRKSACIDENCLKMWSGARGIDLKPVDVACNETWTPDWMVAKKAESGRFMLHWALGGREQIADIKSLAADYQYILKGYRSTKEDQMVPLEAVPLELMDLDAIFFMPFLGYRNLDKEGNIAKADNSFLGLVLGIKKLTASALNEAIRIASFATQLAVRANDSQLALYWCLQSELASLKSAIGSIMSRNGSHNIGSHVLAALSHNVGTLPDDRVLYQYIQQRMDYIATVTTDFPTWTQSTMFVADMIKTFLSQRHLLDHIVESEGLHAFQFQNPNMTDEEWEEQENCVRIHVRKVDVEGIKDFIEYEKDDIDKKVKRNAQIDLTDDVALAIPGGIIGEHAFYTILENIIRNAAKHSWAKIKQWQIRQNEIELQYNNLELFIDFEEKDDEVKFNVYAKLPMAQVVVEKIIDSVQLDEWREKFDDLGVVKAEEKDNFKKLPDNVQQQIKLHLPDLNDEGLKNWVDRYDKSDGLTFDEQEEFDSLAIHHKQQIMLARPFIDSQGALRRENWGMAEMKISAGYLVGESIEAIGGIGDKKGSNEIITPRIKSEKVKRKCLESGEKVTEIEVEEQYLGYEFSIAKPKEILIVVEEKLDENDGSKVWGNKNIREELKKCGIFIKTVDEIKQEKRLNYRYVVHYDANKLFDKDYQVIGGILLPFRVMSGVEINDGNDRLKRFIPTICMSTIQGYIKSAIKDAKQKIEQLIYTQYINHLKNQRKKERIKEIGLLVAINENEKSGGNSLISDADILELMMEQNFAVCVDQYKAFVANEDNRNIIKCLESIRHKSSAKDKVIKFKHFSNKTIRELIAQRMCDWAEKSNDSWSLIVEHLRKKYFVSDAESETPNELKPSSNKTSDDFEANVNSLLQKHPIDDFIRYMESVFENTKKLFKQYEEQIVTLPAGYKVQSSDVGEGASLIDGIKIITSAEKGELEKGKDRHWIGYRRHAHTLPVDDSKRLYVEPLSGTQTYLSQLARVKTNLGLQMRLIENGLMRILVLDERVAKFLREHQKEVGPHYKAMNINVIDHEWVVAGGKNPPEGFYEKFTSKHKEALKSFVKPQEPNDGENNQNGDADVSSNSNLTMFDDVDILIVHQGILDKWYPEFKNRKDMGKLLEGFKKLVKYVVVTTGRGTPENIPEEAHLLPFAVVESTLFKKYPEKLILTDTIMNVLPVGKKNDNSGGQE